MKITIDKHPDQDPIVTIDTSPCKSTYAIREALQLALELDGYDKETIKNVFNLQEDEKTEPQAEEERVTQEGNFEDTTSGFMSAVSYLKQMDDKILTLIKPHEIVKHANRIWAKNLQASEPAQVQGHFTNNYAGAFDFLLCNGVSVNVIGEGKGHEVENVICKANELWKQQNQTT